MSDSSFYDDDAIIVPHEDGSVSKSICHITVLSIPHGERTQKLSGFAKRLLEETDAVLAACFSGPLLDFAKKNEVKNLSSLSTYRNLTSKDEQALFDLTTEEIAKTSLMLGDIQVSGGEIGCAWALGLRASIFRELYGAYTLEKLLATNANRIVILMPGMGATEYALIARLLQFQEDGRVDLRGVCELKNGTMQPLSCAPVYTAKQILATRRQNQDLSIAPITRERLVGLHKSVLGERPSPADVLFLHMTDSPIFQRNIGSVIDAIKEQEGEPTVMVVSGSATDIYMEKLDRKKIYKFNPKVQWEDKDMLVRLQSQITSRVEVACLNVTPLSTWTPLLAATDKTSMFASLKKLLVFRSALNLMTGFVKPKSVYITQSPATNAYAYMALTSVRNFCNCYYSFSTMLTEGAHSLPYIAPASLLAYGKQDKALISARNELAALAINVVGTPSYDHINDIDVAAVRAQMHTELDLKDNGQNIVLMTSRLNSEQEDQWLARFLRWAHNEDVNCILVKHRRAGAKNYEMLENMAKNKQWDRVRIVNYDRINAIVAADVVVTDQSEAAIEAILLDKVIVQLRLAQNPQGKGNFISGVGFEVSTEAALHDVVNGALLDKDYMPDEMKKARDEFKNLVNGQNDGGAARKIAEKLLSGEKYDYVFDNPFAEFFILPAKYQHNTSPVKDADFTV